jgi:hypothetical protein
MDNITLLSQLFGQGLHTARRLKDAGIDRPEKLMEINTEELSQIADMTVSEARAFLNAALEMLEGKRQDFKGRFPKQGSQDHSKKQRTHKPLSEEENSFDLN